MKSKKPLEAYSSTDVDKYRKQFVVATLRRSSYRWPWRSIAANRARVGWGLYQCEQCAGLVLSSEKKLDHIEPVVSPQDGFLGWDSFINRLLVDAKGFQVLCWVCHEEKTEKENNERKATRNKAR